MVFNATFSNTISVISCMAVSFIGGGNWITLGKPPTCRKSLTNLITECCIEHNSPWTRFELTILVVICTDCTDSCKSNYHKITTTKALSYILNKNSSELCMLNFYRMQICISLRKFVLFYFEFYQKVCR